MIRGGEKGVMAEAAIPESFLLPHLDNLRSISHGDGQLRAVRHVRPIRVVSSLALFPFHPGIARKFAMPAGHGPKPLGD